MPRYDYKCDACATTFDVERSMDVASEPCDCPFCGDPSRRVFTMPRLLIKPDPNDNRPVWHAHGMFGHSHAPGRGFHGRRKGAVNEE